MARISVGLLWGDPAGRPEEQFRLGDFLWGVVIGESGLPWCTVRVALLSGGETLEAVEWLPTGEVRTAPTQETVMLVDREDT